MFSNLVLLRACNIFNTATPPADDTAKFKNHVESVNYNLCP